MSSLLGFIQLLLVLVPVGKKQQRAVIVEQKKFSIHTPAIVEAAEASTSNHTLIPLPNCPEGSPATTQDDKGIPATPHSLSTIFFSDQTSWGRSLSSKPFRSCALYILYCQLKSDC